MSFLEELLKDYHSNVANVANGGSTNATNAYHTENTIKKDKTNSPNSVFEGKKAQKTVEKSPMIAKSYEKVGQMSHLSHACGEVSTQTSNPLLGEKPSFSPSSVGTYARASDNCDKFSGCDSCPACGPWDGYAPWKMPPGRYCFHRSYFIGHPGKPSPIDTAKENCPLKNTANPEGHKGEKNGRSSAKF